MLWTPGLGLFVKQNAFQKEIEIFISFFATHLFLADGKTNVSLIHIFLSAFDKANLSHV